MVTQTPMEHQQLAIVGMREWFSSLPNQNAYLEMPTGSGKTFTTVAALEPLLASGRVLWIAPSQFLLEQAAQQFRACYPTLDGQIGSLTKATSTQRVTMATIQTLARDEKRLAAYCKEGKPTIAVFDEFHRSAADTWRNVVGWLGNQRVPVLGLSATPTRTDAHTKRWLHQAFPLCTFRIGINELVNARVLARPQLFRVPVDSSEKIIWSEKEIAEARQFHDVPQSVLKRLAAQESRNKSIIRTFKTHPDIRQAIVFCCTQDHAVALAKQFSAAKVNARAVIGDAKSQVNRDALDAFRSGDVHVLTSVLLLTEGVDLPACNTVIIARPTQSEILLKQMIGRGLRGKPAGGNATCTIIDFVDAFENVGDMSGTSRGWTRTYGKELGELLRKRPKPNQRDGLDLAHLLRVRDWLAQLFARSNETDRLGELFLEEVEGFLEFFDETEGVSRSVTVMKSVRKPFQAALTDVTRDYERNPAGWQTPISAAASTRKIYNTHFRDDETLSEEDFVAVVGEGMREGEDFEMRSPEEVLERLVESDVLQNEAVAPVRRDLSRIMSLIARLG
jgi:superfamily II DNA or RNA helicase